MLSLHNQELKMQVAGVRKQEQKIEALADIVVELHPGLARLSVKGAFRLGLSDTLRETGYAQWKDVAEKAAPERLAFFDRLLDHSMEHLLKMGLPEALRGSVHERLRAANEKFVSQ
jgi:hypothetical protein